jgi:hypothetical protein
MEWIKLITDLIKALVWPIVLLIIFLVLRKHLISLLSQITKFKYKDFEFEFSKTIREAQVISEQIQLAQKSPSSLRGINS